MPASRLSALDGMRGVAALLVVVMHGQAMLGTQLFERAYLMVDLFFLMSGFVLAAAYGARLEAGGAGGWFAGRRLVRLWPLAVVGLLLGAVTELALAAHLNRPVNADFAAVLAAGALMLPWLAGGLVVPFDGPLWSLQAEVWANTAWGFAARWLTPVRLAAVCALSGAALVMSTALTGSFDGGFANNDPSRHAGPFAFLIGFARIGFSFPLGVLLHRAWAAGRLPVRRLPFWTIPAALVPVSLIPLGAPAALDLAIVAVLFPMLLAVAVGGMQAGPLAGEAGRISYALYVLHGPVLVLLRGLAPASLPSPLRAALFAAALALSLLLAHLAERWIDRPARRWAARRAPAPLTAGV